VTRMLLLLFSLAFAWNPSPAFASDPPVADGLTAPDRFTLIGPESFVTGSPAVNPDGTINAVIEIPAGTTAKWEVGEDGVLRWEIENGKPRVVEYLGYPVNYGMVPRTRLPQELGGDGDPLDILVLGRAMARGSVIRVRVVGVLEMLDGGEQDDKLLAVREGSVLADVSSLDELTSELPGITEIVETWFSNYKGPGKMDSRGFAGVDRAHEILGAASRAYDRAHAAETAPDR